MNKRALTSWVAEETGLSMRQVQQMAIEGKIPSAAKLGGAWTFNRKAVESWIKQEEEQCRKHPKTSTDGGLPRSGGRASKFVGKTTDEAYERALRP